jgi:Skp family chaperone for outer membrane proteins
LGWLNDIRSTTLSGLFYGKIRELVGYRRGDGESASDPGETAKKKLEIAIYASRRTLHNCPPHHEPSVRCGGGRCPRELSGSQVTEDPLQQGVLDVKKLLFGLLSIAVLVSCSAMPCMAQAANGAAPAASSAGASSSVAVIDISYIFEHHERFKAAIEAMKTDVEAFEMTLRGRGKEIEDLRAKMVAFKPGTQQFKELEEAITKKQADVQAEAQIKRNEFLDREAKIYYNVYMEVQDAVTKFAQANRIRLVIRFDSEPIDPENRHKVLAAVNRGVVYVDRLNITEPILQQLNRASGAAVSRAPAAGGAVAPK